MKYQLVYDMKGQRKLFLVNERGNNATSFTREQFVQQLGALCEAAIDPEVFLWLEGSLEDEARIARETEIRELEAEISKLKESIDRSNLKWLADSKKLGLLRTAKIALEGE